MRATDFGQVPVMIRKSNMGKEAGNIALIYDRTDYYSKTTIIVRLNTRSKYTHERVKLSWLRYYYSYKKGSQSLPLEEAKEWLRAYCTYNRINPAHLKLVSSFGRAANGFFEIDMSSARGERDDGLS